MKILCDLDLNDASNAVNKLYHYEYYEVCSSIRAELKDRRIGFQSALILVGITCVQREFGIELQTEALTEWSFESAEQTLRNDQESESKFDEYYSYVLNLFSNKGPLLHKTGSRVFGDYEKGSNYDLILNIRPNAIDEVQKKLFDEKFTQSGETYSGEHFWFFRKNPENINLIVTDNMELFDRWVRCTEFCRDHRLVKSKRQVVFSYIID